MSQERAIAMVRRLSVLVAGAMAVMVMVGCNQPGRRLLTMEVYENDQLVLRTKFDVPDSEGPSGFWRRAGEAPFASDEQVARVEADDDNPLRARLTGAVRIRILHVDRVLSSASVTDCGLVRNSPDTLGWYLPEKEVQRATQAAGF